MSHLRMPALLALALMASVPQARAAIVIDSFDVTQTLAAPPTARGFANGPTTSIIGGQRDVLLTRTSGSLSINFNANAIPNSLLISAATLTAGNARIDYDGTEAGSPTTVVDGLNRTGLVGIDATQNGANNGIGFIGGADLSDATIDVLFFTNNTSASRGTITIPVDPARNTHFFLPFTSFAQATGVPVPLVTSAANFASLGALRFTITLPIDRDVLLRFTAFTNENAFFAPEPATLGSGLVAILGLFGYGWRRRRVQDA